MALTMRGHREYWAPEPLLSGYAGGVWQFWKWVVVGGRVSYGVMDVSYCEGLVSSCETHPVICNWGIKSWHWALTCASNLKRGIRKQ
jgi:hypothetical protein